MIAHSFYIEGHGPLGFFLAFLVAFVVGFALARLGGAK